MTDTDILEAEDSRKENMKQRKQVRKSEKKKLDDKVILQIGSKSADEAKNKSDKDKLMNKKDVKLRECQTEDILNNERGSLKFRR